MLAYNQALLAETSPQDFQITAKDGTELNLSRFPATGDYLLIWIAPGYGIQERSIQIAKQLSVQGVEVWQIDLAEALFLPHSTEQMREINGQYVADLIEAAFKITGKKIVLCSQSYGSIPLLHGARIWQTAKPPSAYLIGAILFSPDLYSTIPPLGLEPEYMPITSATNLPIFIIQDEMRGNRWYVDRLINTLQKGGSNPQLTILNGVSGLFFGDDNSPNTFRALTGLPTTLLNAIHKLETTPTPLTAANMQKTFKPVGSGIDNKLKKYKGKFLPLPIDLPDINGQKQRRDNYRDKVTIVNFWASWCSPCVQEIPSLNRLRDKVKHIPLELISINYAEDAQTIKEFMHKVDVLYPVLLDSTGQISARWKVVAFPSTYIIGADGKIHQAVNAAIQWDTPEVIEQLTSLYQTTHQHTATSNSK